MEKELKSRIVHTALEKSTWRKLALISIDKDVSVSSLIRQAIEDSFTNDNEMIECYRLCRQAWGENWKQELEALIEIARTM